jgi:hypothetical protein
MLRITVFLTAAWLALPTVSGVSADDQWGDLALRLVYDGEPPKPAPLKIVRDKGICKAGELVDESLLVSAKDKGIANVIVWLAPPAGAPAIPIHPDYEKNIPAEVPLVIKGCRYERHVTVVRPPQALVIHNQDPIAYNVRFDLVASTSLNVLLLADEKQPYGFQAAEKIPVPLSDAVHPWMRAVSDASGQISLKNLPAGRWTFRLWHERRGYLRSFTRGGDEVLWPNEGLTLDIKPGANDLGDVLIKPAVFKE